MTVEEFLERRKTEDSEVLKDVYLQCRPMCVGWLMKQYPKLDADKAVDVFMEAVLILWHNAGNDSLKATKYQVSTYLTTVCRNIQNNEKSVELIDPFELHFTEIFKRVNPDNEMTPVEMEQFLTHLEECINQLGDTCKTIIKGYYLEDKSLGTIAEELKMEYRVVVSSRYNCFNRLKNIFFNKK